MSVLGRLTYTGLTSQLATAKTFVEKATIKGTGNGTLILYDGEDATGNIIAEIACVANGFSSNDNINQSCPDGVYAVMTTGSGLATAMVYNR